MKTWTQAAAVDLCRKIEAVCPQFGCHVALTGGCLYKDGERKDLDILFYRIRQVPKIDWIGLIKALENLDLFLMHDFGWCKKFAFVDDLEGEDLKIDAFDPEETRTVADDHYVTRSEAEDLFLNEPK